jgi:hypothetical protein
MEDNDVYSLSTSQEMIEEEKETSQQIPKFNKTNKTKFDKKSKPKEEGKADRVNSKKKNKPKDENKKESMF